MESWRKSLVSFVRSGTVNTSRNVPTFLVLQKPFQPEGTTGLVRLSSCWGCYERGAKTLEGMNFKVGNAPQTFTVQDSPGRKCPTWGDSLTWVKEHNINKHRFDKVHSLLSKVRDLCQVSSTIPSSQVSPDPTHAHRWSFAMMHSNETPFRVACSASYPVTNSAIQWASGSGCEQRASKQASKQASQEGREERRKERNNDHLATKS